MMVIQLWLREHREELRWCRHRRRKAVWMTRFPFWRLLLSLWLSCVNLSPSSASDSTLGSQLLTSKVSNWRLPSLSSKSPSSSKPQPKGATYGNRGKKSFKWLNWLLFRFSLWLMCHPPPVRKFSMENLPNDKSLCATDADLFLSQVSQVYAVHPDSWLSSSMVN